MIIENNNNKNIVDYTTLSLLNPHFHFYLDFSYFIFVLTKMHSENLTYLTYRVITNQNFHK